MDDAPDPIAKPGRALGFSVSAVLGDPSAGDPNVVFQTHFDVDMPEAEVHQGVDAIMRVVERQQAKAEIGRIERHIRQAEKMIVRAGGEYDETAYTAAVAALREQIAERNGRAPGILEKDRLAFEQAGRAGPYRQSQRASGEIAGLKREATAIQQQIFTLNHERSENLKAIAQKTQGWRDEIDEARQEIARLRGIVHGEAPPLAMAAE
jgi:chromosome segregation ATPase